LRSPSAALLLGVLGLLGTTAGPGAQTPPAAPTAPALVVVISIDQFRGDYVELYGHQWTAGLHRLLRDGARFPLAAFPYMNTVTCPGHATIGTGTLPFSHGLVLNSWWDREDQREVTCTEDREARGLPVVAGAAPVEGAGHSPLRLRVPSFADELRARAAVPPRIAAFSLKARSAIMMTGRRADAIAWFHGEHGWMTSTAYGPPPAFLTAYVAAHPIQAAAGTVWTRSVPVNAYLFEDAGLAEDAPEGWTSTFPHELPARGSARFADLWAHTPLADAYLGGLAAEAARSLGLGKTRGTDYLAVSFSTLDTVGHAFGPRSHEVQDVLMGLDRTIGRLLDDLDRLVGAGRYTVALTGDHGVAPIPEQMRALGLDAGRLTDSQIAARVNTALEPFLGPGKHVARLAYTDLYFANGVLERLRATPGAFEAAVTAIETAPGVERVLEGRDLPSRRGDGDARVRAAALGYVPDRSGDLVLVPRAYWPNTREGTTHGTSNAYDQRVPVVLAGAGIRPGTYFAAASPADIAPTLAFLAGTGMSRADGRVLHEALLASGPFRQQPAAAAPR
jgi:predicted AlkP superfamily pyrophosphatase or phosphodiesterase